MLTVILRAVGVIPSAARNLLFQGRWALILTALAVSALLVLTCHRPTPAPLPSTVSERVERHAIQTAIDSAEVTHLQQSAARSHSREQVAVVHAHVAADSGDYRAAYALDDTALLAADRQVASLDFALTRSESRAIRGDSVIAALLPLIESREPPCRFLRFIPCPTRRAVAFLASAITATGIITAPRLLHR